MSDELTGLAAYAWSLHKYAYTSAGGRFMRDRNIYIMTIDNFFMVGFETLGRRPRYTVIRYGSAAAAQKHAVLETQRREKEGFKLHITPRTATTRGGKRSWLEALTTSDEDHNDLHVSVMHLVNNGKELGAESPESVPRLDT